MCNCIQNVEEDIKNREGAAFVSFEHLGNQRSEVSFLPYTAQGAIYKHRRYTSVSWRYCPFCGQPTNLL